jgi:PAS domain S-box-containing protein
MTNLNVLYKIVLLVCFYHSPFPFLFSHIIVGIACMDSTGNITSVNKTFEQMIGYSESELTSTPVSEMLHPDDVARARGGMRQVVSGETQSVDMPLRFIHKVSHNVVWAVASLMQIEKVYILFLPVLSSPLPLLSSPLLPLPVA